MSVTSLVQSAIDNVRQLDVYNAVNSIQDDALTIAKKYDERLAIMSKKEIELLPPFFGVPTLLKDLGSNQKGYPSTAGSKLLENYLAEVTDNEVQGIIDMGFIIIGRTNVPEFGFKNISDSETKGTVSAPFDATRSPGGSSGGAAAALKAGWVPITVGSDGGGSIRIPASFSGLIGLKPTRGRIPVGPTTFRGWQGASISFMLTKTIRDTRKVLKHWQTTQLDAAFTMPSLTEDDFLRARVKALGKLNIAYSTQTPDGSPLDPHAEAAVLEMVETLKKLGHTVKEDQPKIDGIKAMKTYYVVNAVETAKMLETIASQLGRELTMDDMEVMTWAIYRSGYKISGIEYSQVLAYWDQLGYTWQRFFDDYDLYLTPTNNGIAPKHGELVPSDEILEQLGRIDEFDRDTQQSLLHTMFADSLALTPFTQQMNLSGQPAISLPTYKTEDGFPIGTQFVAPRQGEPLLLAIGEILEEAGYLDASIVE